MEKRRNDNLLRSMGDDHKLNSSQRIGVDSVNTAKDVYHLQESLVLILFVVSRVLYLFVEVAWVIVPQQPLLKNIWQFLSFCFRSQVKQIKSQRKCYNEKVGLYKLERNKARLGYSLTAILIY